MAPVHPACAGTPQAMTTSTVTTTDTITEGFPCRPTLATVPLMSEAKSRSPKNHAGQHHRPLWEHVLIIAASVLLVFVLPVILANALAGPTAAYAVLMGSAAVLSGASRSGWARTVKVIPYIGLLGFLAASVAYGWGWVAVMAVVGLVAGAGYPFGYLPVLLSAGFVPTLVHPTPGTRDAVVAGILAMCGAAMTLELARRLGFPRTTPSPPRVDGGGALMAVVGVVMMGGGSAIAIATGLPHGYWIPLTLIAVVPALSTGASHRGRDRLVGTLAALLIVFPVSFIPMPPWMFYVLGTLLYISALVVMRKSYTFYAFVEAAAVVMLVSAGQDVLATGADRAISAIIAIILLVVAVPVVTFILRHLPRVHASARAVDGAH